MDLDNNKTNMLCGQATTCSYVQTEEETRSIVERVVWSLFLFMILTASLVGNMFVIICIRQQHRLREDNGNLFVINLSVTDICSAVVVISSSLHAMALDEWRMGQLWCNIVCGANYMLIIVSLLTLCFIALDRYTAVKHALRYHACVTKKRIYILVVYSWFQGLCFGIVPIVREWIRYDYWEVVCAIVWHMDRNNLMIYVIVGFTVCFLLPSLMLVIAYCKVMKIAIAHNNVHPQNAQLRHRVSTERDVSTTNVASASFTQRKIINNNENMAPIRNAINNVLPQISSDDEIFSSDQTFQSEECLAGNQTKSAEFQNNTKVKEDTFPSSSNFLGENRKEHNEKSCSNRSQVIIGDRHTVEQQKNANHFIKAEVHLTHSTSFTTISNTSNSTQLKDTEITSCEDSNESRLLPHSSLDQRSGISAHILDDTSPNSCMPRNPDSLYSPQLNTHPSPASKSEVNRGQKRIQWIAFSSADKSFINDVYSQHRPKTFDIQDDPQDSNAITSADNLSSLKCPDLKAQERLHNTGSNNSEATTPTNYNHSTIRPKRNSAANNKVIKSLIIIIVAYLICMTPFSVTKLYKVVFPQVILPGYVNLTASVFQYCSSVINPLIYGIFRKDFQRAFLLLLKKVFVNLKTKDISATDFQSGTQ